MDYLIVGLLIIASGTFSGLTIGLMGLSKTEVLRAKDLGDKEASVVSDVIKDSNLLLVTLLVGNTAVNSTLSIFLGAVVGTGVVAGLVSTALIVVFGEILPASVVSQHPLKVGSALTPFVKFILFIFYPISKPIAIVLDKYVGVEGLVVFSRKELQHIFEQLKNSQESDIDELDKKALVGTILLNEKIAGEHMSKNIYTIEDKTLLTEDLFLEIKEKGHTRIPIIDKSDSKYEVVGILNSKELINVSSKDKLLVNDLMRENIMTVDVEDKLDDVMNKLIKRRSHLALVMSYETIVGVITLEDIIEEMLLTEIQDEFDHETETIKS